MSNEKLDAALKAYRQADALYQEKWEESRRLNDEAGLAQEQMWDLRAKREKAESDLLKVIREEG
jgi:hypothetical protein